VEIELGPGAHALVTGPSATKILKGGCSPAEQTTHIRLAEEATLEFVPPYVIPFAGASYRQRTVVQMEETSTCLMLDWFATGRTSRGESLAFDEYDSLTEISSGGETLVHDRFVLRPKDEDYRAPGLLQSCNVSASIYLIHRRPDLSEAMVQCIREAAGEAAELCGASAVDSRRTIVRMMGASVPPVQRAVARTIGIMRQTLLGIGDEELFDRLFGAL
jgi:urease accessory protein UreH